MLPLPGFVKDAFPYGLITYLLLDNYSPYYAKPRNISAVKQSVALAQMQQYSDTINMLDIDKPMPTSLSGFNYKTEQGVGGFIDKILTKGPNFNISGGLNYGYSNHRGHQARWH